MLSMIMVGLQWLRWAGLPILLLLLATPTAATTSASSSSPSPPTHTHGPLACGEHAFRVTVHRSRRDPSPTPPAAPPSPSPSPADIFGEVAFPAPCVVVVALRIVTTDPLPSRVGGVPSDAPGADDLTLAVTLRHDYGRHSFGLPLPPLPQRREPTSSSSPAGDTPASASSASSVSSLDHYMQASDGALQLEVSLRRGISVEASWGAEEALAAAELSFHIPTSAATRVEAEVPLGRGGPPDGDSGDSGGPPPPPEAVKTERRVFGPEEDGAVWPLPERQRQHRQQQQQQQQQQQNAEQGKLRVALVHHYLWRGGVESLIANLCHLLPREHFEVTVVLITDWGTADQTSERARSVLTGAGCTCVWGGGGG